MSTATIPSGAIPHTIRHKLSELRRRVLLWMLADGLSRLCATAVILILIDAALDRLFRMDYAQRLIMLCLMVGILAAVAVVRIVWPLRRRPSDDALALRLEHRHRGLGESLISAVQFARSPREWIVQGVSPALVEETIRQGAAAAQQLDLRSAINRAALQRSLAVLAISLAALGAIAWAIGNTEFWRTWYQRNVLLGSQTWPLDTRLHLVGVEQGRLVLPRGEDHTQLVEIDSASRIQDVDVYLEIDDGQVRRSHQMESTGRLEGRERQWTIRGIAQPIRFRARGGDHVTDWVSVSLVEPPSLEHLVLITHFPNYTGRRPEALSHGSGPHVVLQGSSLQVRARANKPMDEATIWSEDRQWALNNAAGDDPQTLTVQIPAEELSGGKYTFHLVDTNGLKSTRPPSFAIRIAADRPPRVRASLLGISGLVASRARIPITFVATDEFAVSNVELVYQWRSTEDQGIPREESFAVPEIDQMLGQSEVHADFVFDLEPLELPTGVGLRLVLRATDNNTLNGPGVGESRDFLLRVVSEDELRNDLLRREIEQRRIFETAIAQQEELMVELRAIAGQYRESPPTDAARHDELRHRLMAAQRRQRSVSTSIATIADRFEQLLVEAQNNRLDEEQAEIENVPTITQRLEDRIIVPLRRLDEEPIPRAYQRIDIAIRAVPELASFSQAMDEALNAQMALIDQMRRILAAMQDSETFQEVVNKAIEVRRTQQQLRELTRERQREIRDRDIFDDDP